MLLSVNASILKKSWVLYPIACYAGIFGIWIVIVIMVIIINNNDTKNNKGIVPRLRFEYNLKSRYDTKYHRSWCVWPEVF